MLLELFLLVLIIGLARLFFSLPRIDNPGVGIVVTLVGNGYLWNWLSKYFSKHHKQIVKNRFQPIHTSATIDSLIYLSIVIVIIFLTAVATFSIPKHL